MSVRVAALALAAALLAGLAGPEAARACAVCAGQDDAAVGLAMLKGSLLLSLLPLAMIGGGVWYLRRRARQIEAAETRSGVPPAVGRSA